MCLKRKIVLTLSVVFAMLALMTYAVQRGIVYPHFARLENDGAIKDITRCVEDITREIEHLTILCQDWAAWDDSYRFMDDGNEAFVAATLGVETLATAELNLVCFYDTNGETIWATLFDVDNARPIDDPAFLESIRTNRLLSVHDSIDGARSGVILTHRGPMLVSSHPILTSQHGGPSRGSLVMGRFFDDDQVGAVVERTRVGLRMWPLNIELPAHERAMIHKISSTHPSGIVEAGEEVLHAYASYADLNGSPALLLRAEVPRDISRRGWVATRYAVLTTLVGGALLLLITWAILHRAVVAPLQRVTAHAIALGKDDNLTSRLDMSRRGDEIGALAREFDQMVARLHESRSKMIDTAHRAGMADLAGEVLHNVGNALNTVCMATEEIGEQLRESKVEGYRKAMAIVAENQDHLAEFFSGDERGRKVLSYLFKLSDLLSTEHADLDREYRTLREKVEHIREIIRAQQVCAARGEVVEAVGVAQVVEDVLKMQQRPIERARVRVVRELDDAPVIRVNRNKLTQVLVHLVKNAIEAMSQNDGVTAAATSERTLTVRSRVGDDQLQLEITDSGVGIEPGQIERLFRAGGGGGSGRGGGASTKPNGHGAGLHFCANAIHALGGKLAARSDGPGRGATFVIQLSLKGVEVNA